MTNEYISIYLSPMIT